MKKILVALAVLVASTSAFADTAFVKYDYDRANSGQGAWKSQHEVQTGFAVDSKLGTLDVAAVGRQLVTNVRDNNLGLEVGYSNGLSLGNLGVTGRVAYGRVNLVDVGGGGFTGNSEYYSLAAEATLPLSADVSVFTGYRFRDNLNGATAQANRISAGLDIKLAPNFTVRGGWAYTNQAGYHMNGVTAGVSYKF